MLKFDNAYPYFSNIVKETIVLSRSAIELPQRYEPINTLFKINRKLEHLLMEMGREPTHNNANLEEYINGLINNCRADDVDTEGVVLEIYLKPNADKSRFVRGTLNIYKQ